MTIEKANWYINGDDIRVVMPFSKVDHETRTTSGFATLNNVDSSDDVVTAECSSDAFNRFRGNIREMHQPKAVGSMLSFAQEPYLDNNTGMMYEGIWMNSYVSKGAPDTWEKVLDKTLTGYSIGGVIIEQHQEYIPELDKTIRFIDKMDLHEVSLVDNPANPLANILSIEKVNGEYVAKGLAVDVKTENVFFCPEHQIGRASSQESLKCRAGNHQMENVGWIEVTPDTNLASELKKSIDSHVEKVLTTQTIKDGDASKNPDQKKELANEENVGDNKTQKGEGGVDMTDTVEKAADVSEVAADETATDETVVKADESKTETDAVVEKAADEVKPETVVKADEAKPEEGLDINKALGEIVAVVGDMAKAVSSLATVVTEVKESTETLATAQKSAETAAAEALDTVGKRLGDLEKATAGKKSGDDDEVVKEPVKKSFDWNGTFASASSFVE